MLFDQLPILLVGVGQPHQELIFILAELVRLFDQPFIMSLDEVVEPVFDLLGSFIWNLFGDEGPTRSILLVVLYYLFVSRLCPLCSAGVYIYYLVGLLHAFLSELVAIHNCSDLPPIALEVVHPKS